MYSGGPPRPSYPQRFSPFLRHRLPLRLFRAQPVEPEVVRQPIRAETFMSKHPLRPTILSYGLTHCQEVPTEHFDCIHRQLQPSISLRHFPQPCSTRLCHRVRLPQALGLLSARRVIFKVCVLRGPPPPPSPELPSLSTSQPAPCSACRTRARRGAHVR